MDNETTVCTCPRCLQKDPLGVSMTKKVASNHQRAFLWVQQLEEQIDDSYVNFNTTTQLSPNLSQNSSIYTNNNSLEISFNSQDNINDLYQNFVMEEYTNDILLETNE
ncbi:10634_t:CDS:2, partial [Gigaspora rosea]